MLYIHRSRHTSVSKVAGPVRHDPDPTFDKIRMIRIRPPRKSGLETDFLRNPFPGRGSDADPGQIHPDPQPWAQATPSPLPGV